MKIELQRRLDRILGSVICRGFSLLRRREKASKTPANPSSILIILLSEMGSLVLAYPMFKTFKQKLPKTSIHVLSLERNKEILEILDVVPKKNIHSINDSSLFRFAKDSFITMKRLRKLKPEAVIDCELFARISSLFSFLTGAPIRVGFHPHTQEGLYRGDFINRPVPYNPYCHISQQFLTLVEAIDSATYPKAKHILPESFRYTPPSISLKGREIDQMSKRLKRDFPQILGRRLVLIYPGGGLLPIRAWPSAYFHHLAVGLIEEGFSVGIIGLEADRGLARVILSQTHKRLCVDFTGYTASIRELLILFAFASLLITNDGGPGHFASLTSLPAIILFGPETPVLYGSLSECAFNFYRPFSCSPCLTAYNHRHSPCDGKNLCLEYIRPEEVLDKALEMLSRSAERGEGSL